MKNKKFNELFEEYFCNIGILDSLAQEIEQKEKEKGLEEEKKQSES